jgi:predicted Zn-dependent protease
VGVPVHRPHRHAVAGLAGTLAALLLACGAIGVRQEEDLGEETARELKKQLDFMRDAWVVDYVRDIGHEILTAAGPQPFDYTFHVVDDDELNAFALPAGYIYIHTAILLEAANVSEVAGVVAHEVGHVVRRHVARNYNRQRNTGVLYQLGSVVAAIFLGGNAAAGGQILGELAAVAYLNQFTREAEMEADAFAVEVMPIAGYDPNGLVTFFDTLRRSGGAHVPTFLASHPATEDRIRHTAALIADAPAQPGLRISDGGHLELIQRRITLLTGHARSK